MPFLSRIRRRVFQRRPVLGTVTIPVLAEDIKSGQVRPEDLSLDTDRQVISGFEDRPKIPWYDLWSFLKSVVERRQTTGLKPTRKKYPRSPEGVDELNSIAGPHPLTSASKEGENRVNSKQKNAVIEKCARMDGPAPGTVEEGAGTCASSSETTHTPTAVALLIDGTELESARVNELVAKSTSAETLTEAATLSGESDLEAFLEIHDGQNDLKMMTDGMPDMPDYFSPLTIQSSEFCTSAVTIKDGQGVEHAEKLLYDTGSVVNLSTTKFASAHRLKQRPIRVDDVVVYDIPDGSIAPTHYMEMEMKDPKRGINDFVRVRFILVATLGGLGLLLGTGFIHQYGIVLDPKQGSGTYPVTARTPGPG